MIKKSKKLVAVITMICVMTVMAVPVLAGDAKPVTVGNTTYSGKATYSSSASYYTVNYEFSGKYAASSLVCQPAWKQSNTYVEGRKTSGSNVKKITGSSSNGPKNLYSGCTVFMVATKGGTTKQTSASVTF